MGDEEHDDRKVTRRSNDECRRIARDTKAYFAIGRTWPVNIRRVLSAPKVLTVFGEKPFKYCVVDDQTLGLKDARTELIHGMVVITVKRAIDSLASFGEGRARMTLAHELGHAVMHGTPGVIDHRAAGAAGITAISKLNAAESAEHQAKVFASAFLIDDVRASELASPLDIATEFLVSLSAAEICHERIQAELERQVVAARVLEANKAFQEQASRNDKKSSYLAALCISCRCQTLLPLGIKVGCETCGYVGDHPEDG